MRGPKPAPTKLKILRGNPGKRKLNAREPKVDAVVPQPPEWLDADALDKWHELCAVLGPTKILSTLDADVLTLYCETWIEWKNATLGIRQRGMVVKAPSGYPMINPYVSIRNKALNQLRALESELGMTPSARSRLQVPESREPSSSKWDGMLTG